MTRQHVLICGISARAAAESAARAGFDVSALDGFADRDQHPSVRALSIVRDFGLPVTAAAMARAGRRVAADAVAYLASFENHPRAVDALAAGRLLWGNGSKTLRRVRDPRLLADTLRGLGHAVPEVRLQTTDEPLPRREWLIKPLRSGGGHRIRPWSGGRLPTGAYLHERIEGTPGSIVFVAAAGRTMPLAVTRQLVGDPNFGAVGFTYTGSILAAADDRQFMDGSTLFARADALARHVAAEFQLVGVNGIDFVASAGIPYPIEVNPRWSASMELVERLWGVSVFSAHVDACAGGQALPFRLKPDTTMTALVSRPMPAAIGKAVVFARRASVAPDTRPWLDDPSVRDVPHPGEHFAPGRPVCTVFATGSDAAACYDALVARADRVYSQLMPALTQRRRLVNSLQT